MKDMVTECFGASTQTTVGVPSCYSLQDPSSLSTALSIGARQNISSAKNTNLNTNLFPLDNWR